MSEEIPTGNEQEEVEGGQGPSQGLVIAVIAAAIAVIVLLVLWLAGVFSGGEEAELTPEVVEPYIEILEPAPGAVLDISEPVVVKGNGGALFEGNVVVQALDEAGNVVAEEPTTISSPDAGTGGEGPWEVAQEVNTKTGTVGTIRAFSTSPADGSVTAADIVSVQYGEAEIVESYINIAEPADGSMVDVASSHVL